MSYSQTQKSVIGSTPNQKFGRSVDIDGYNALVSDNIGNVYLYTRSSSGTWTYSSVICSGSGSGFGSSIDICGKYFVVGDPSFNSNAGRVSIYSVDSVSSPIQSISGELSGDKFGSSVSISNSYVIVGSPESESYRGKAYIYIRDDETWTSYSYNSIVPSIRTENDYFGCSVGIYDNVFAIGSRGDNQATGAVYIFAFDESSNEWYESSKLLSSDGGYGDQFGGEVSLSNGYMAVSSKFYDNGEDINAGAVYIFKYDSSWHEIDKLTGVSESSYAENNFGYSIRLRGDYLIVGSPGARNSGVADIFYKQRSWGHLSKIISSDIESGDNFGISVDISESYAIVGAYGESPDDFGAIYFFESYSPNLRLAQEFEVNGEFVPSKSSLFLRRSGKNSSDYWVISNTSRNVIDATNFSTITKSDNRVIFSDDISGYTGNGYMYMGVKGDGDFDIINYNIKATLPDTFYLWIRCLSTSDNYFKADLFMDGVNFRTISKPISDPSSLVWTWIGTTITIPDTEEHVFGIKIKEMETAIDKIYIDKENIEPYADGPSYSVSPYLTIHLNVFRSGHSGPYSPLFIYDYKNSITEVVQDDWYNFDIRSLDRSHGYLFPSDFDGNYFLVLSCTGSNSENYIIWDMIDNDEYNVLPSAFRI